jgi:hypothetical protein
MNCLAFHVCSDRVAGSRRTVKFYESRRWSYAVNNDDDAGIPTLMDKLLRMLGAAMLEHEDMDEVRMELGIDSPPRTTRPSASQSPLQSDSDSETPSTIAQPVF